MRVLISLCLLTMAFAVDIEPSNRALEVQCAPLGRDCGSDYRPCCGDAKCTWSGFHLQRCEPLLTLKASTRAPTKAPTRAPTKAPVTASQDRTAKIKNGGGRNNCLAGRNGVPSRYDRSSVRGCAWSLTPKFTYTSSGQIKYGSLCLDGSANWNSCNYNSNWHRWTYDENKKTFRNRGSGNKYLYATGTSTTSKLSVFSSDRSSSNSRFRWYFV